MTDKLYPHVNALNHQSLLNKIQEELFALENTGDEIGCYMEYSNHLPCCSDAANYYYGFIDGEHFVVCPRHRIAYLMKLVSEKKNSMYNDSWHHWERWTYRTWTFKKLGAVKLTKESIE